MNKLIIAVVAIIIIAVGAFALTRDKENTSQNSSNNTPSEEQVSEDTDVATNELDPNNYTDGANIGDTLDATDQAEVTIDINDFIYETTYLKIKKGTKVTWTNKGQVQHDVTSASDSPQGGLESKLLGDGESYAFTFDQPGLYEYFCTPHSSQMKGVITVVD